MGMFRRAIEAIMAYREAIRINPQDADAYYNLGIALYNKGLIDEAIKALRETIRINPQNASAYYYKGLYVLVLIQ